ncbi:hypothetical protein RRG08_029235 [Elysia crispata]|uniref:Uncharacterized protein n=1 Tax=Elysia crispata TaxID=231223 RepID=A0AAE1ALB3_9GAST|nr:hypothetical protein RRG08_029235 [Elysia crispata]
MLHVLHLRAQDWPPCVLWREVYSAGSPCSALPGEVQSNVAGVILSSLEDDERVKRSMKSLRRRPFKPSRFLMLCVRMVKGNYSTTRSLLLPVICLLVWSFQLNREQRLWKELTKWRESVNLVSLMNTAGRCAASPGRAYLASYSRWGGSSYTPTRVGN